ncbi:MAG: hypothetical protein P8L44_16890 [Opitutales bacterium]|nr:hypothetical protein [Opitutales bacterium]
MENPKTADYWAEVYSETVLFKELPGKYDQVWRLQTGDPEIAKRVQRKASYRQVAWPENGFIWIFATAFSSRGNAIRSLSRILRKPCEWVEERQLVAVAGEEVAS